MLHCSLPWMIFLEDRYVQRECEKILDSGSRTSRACATRLLLYGVWTASGSVIMVFLVFKYALPTLLDATLCAAEINVLKAFDGDMCERASYLARLGMLVAQFSRLGTCTPVRFQLEIQGLTGRWTRQSPQLAFQSSI